MEQIILYYFYFCRVNRFTFNNSACTNICRPSKNLTYRAKKVEHGIFQVTRNQLCYNRLWENNKLNPQVIYARS